MGKKCFVTFCKSGYASNPERNISVFSTPKDPELLEKWRKAIPRADRILSQRDGVCEKHFGVECVTKEWASFYKDGRLCQSGNTGRPKLVKNSVPSIFPDGSACVNKIRKKLKHCYVARGKQKAESFRNGSSTSTSPQLPFPVYKIKQEHINCTIVREPTFSYSSKRNKHRETISTHLLPQDEVCIKTEDGTSIGMTFSVDYNIVEEVDDLVSRLRQLPSYIQASIRSKLQMMIEEEERKLHFIPIEGVQATFKN